MRKGLPNVVEKAWGREIWMVNNESENYCGKILEIEKGFNSSQHFHIEKHETFYVDDGILKVIPHCFETGKSLPPILVSKGECLQVDRFESHQLVAVEKVRLIEISTFHRDEDSKRLYT